MRPDRRKVLKWGGGLLATLAAPALLTRSGLAAGPGEIGITMTGRPDGSAVWFDPIGIHIQPGQMVRWTNADQGNSHTATSYSPKIDGRSLRIPAAAKPWNSDYLLPGESFAVRLVQPGVYDYYCQPHEHAGMVGRIVVGTPPKGGWWDTPLLTQDPDLPSAALAAFPDIARIIEQGQVHLH